MAVFFMKFWFASIFILTVSLVFSQADVYYCNYSRVDSLFKASREIPIYESVIARDSAVNATETGIKEFFIGFIPTFVAGTIPIIFSSIFYSAYMFHSVLPVILLGSVIASGLTGITVVTVYYYLYKKSPRRIIAGAISGCAPYPILLFGGSFIFIRNFFNGLPFCG